MKLGTDIGCSGAQMALPLDRFGRFKQSGIGRDGGVEGFQPYLEA
jgi:acyl-CoA reductase-like NAD-dependent aldehyde dehydrogenase